MKQFLIVIIFVGLGLFVMSLFSNDSSTKNDEKNITTELNASGDFGQEQTAPNTQSSSVSKTAGSTEDFTLVSWFLNGSSKNVLNVNIAIKNSDYPINKKMATLVCGSLDKEGNVKEIKKKFIFLTLKPGEVKQMKEISMGRLSDIKVDKISCTLKEKLSDLQEVEQKPEEDALAKPAGYNAYSDELKDVPLPGDNL